jgi:hypothetical protein
VRHSTVLWDPDDDPNGNVQHLAQHEVTKDEVIEVLEHPIGRDVSHRSGRPIVFGETSAGRMIAVVYEEVDGDMVYPITAFDIEL